MPCITLKNAVTGAITYKAVAVGQSFSHGTGEAVLSITERCPDGTDAEVLQAPVNAHQALLTELNEAIGGGAGDWIKALVSPFARATGRKSCTVCEARRLMTNAYGKLKAKYGQVEALRLIGELWQMSLAENPDTTAILTKLKQYIA